MLRSYSANSKLDEKIIYQILSGEIKLAASILRERVKTIHLSDYFNDRAHIYIGDGESDFNKFYSNLDISNLTTIECEIPFDTNNEQIAIDKCRQVKESVENITSRLINTTK